LKIFQYFSYFCEISLNQLPFLYKIYSVRKRGNILQILTQIAH